METKNIKQKIRGWVFPKREYIDLETIKSFDDLLEGRGVTPVL